MSPFIQVKDLSFTLSGNPILKQICIEAAQGEYISIIGPNGAGKSTLIKCLAGIHRGWTGSIQLNKRTFSDYTPRELAKLQSYVPQAEGRSTPLTIEEFVMLGRYPHLSAFSTLKSTDYTAINKAIALAELDSFRHRKLNTLSGGERQMTFIAAALAQESKLLLLDEPSTFLDYRHKANVANLLKKACRETGVTVLAVHHDINTAIASSDRIYALKNASIAFSGTAEEIADSKKLEQLYGTEFQCTSSPGQALPIITTGGSL
ncbi:MAG TPA: ABC transporter ATP-binding protein [Pontiella sp.]